MNIARTIGFTLAIAPALVAGGVKSHGKVISTTLTKIRQTPNAFKNVWVRFPIQFVSLGKVSNPFFTQFVPQRFANFYCWADEQKIWDRQQYDDIFGLMFIAKANERVQDVYKMRVYQRMLVTGVVRNTFQGEPWIEVMDFDPLDRAVNTASLSHLYRGEMLMQKRQWTKALSELSLAPGNHLPKHVMGQVHKKLALCYLRLGESGTAVQHLEQAVAMLKTLDRETRQMAHLAKVKPESFLDRVVATTIEDHQRPMWEAFADEADEVGGGGATKPPVTPLAKPPATKR